MKVIFTSSNLPFALAIRLFTGCKWHHCGVIYNDDFVIESRAVGGVKAVKLDDFKNRGDYVIVDFECENELKATRFLYSQIGKSYDWSGAFAYPFRGDWQDKEKWYCSELVAKALEIGGCKLFRDDVRSITPRDLYISRVGNIIN